MSYYSPKDTKCDNDNNKKNNTNDRGDVDNDVGAGGYDVGDKDKDNRLHFVCVTPTKQQQCQLFVCAARRRERILKSCSSSNDKRHNITATNICIV